jgi:hypothetical protein
MVYVRLFVIDIIMSESYINQLINLDQDPEGYWIAYDLRLQLGWADDLYHFIPWSMTNPDASYCGDPGTFGSCADADDESGTGNYTYSSNSTSGSLYRTN